MGGCLMSNLYAIWVFDTVRRDIPVKGVVTRTTAIDCVLYESCTDGWDRDRCERRARLLEERQGRVFICRRKLSHLEWEHIPQADWNRGVARVQAAIAEDRARTRVRNLQKRISRSGMPPPKETADGR
jgi:hypothetical protein